MATRKTTEDYLTFTGKSDTRAQPNTSERDLAAELYKKSYQGKTIDQFEKNLGINPPRQKRNLVFKSKLFNLDYQKDADLYGELMNNPKYSIVYFKDNWTVEGLYKMAVIYSEDLDYQTPEEKLKDIAENK